MNKSLLILLFRSLWLSAMLLGVGAWGQTNLQPGDVAIIGVNANNRDCGESGEDLITLVFFKDITRLTQFYITDNGYTQSSNRWNNSEGIYRLTYNGTTPIPKGTLLQFTFPNGIPTGNTTGTMNVRLPSAYRNWSILPLSGSVNLNNGGDQIYILKSLPATSNTWNGGTANSHNATYNGTPLYAFNTRTQWNTPSGASGNSRTQNSNLHPRVTPCYFMNPTSATDFSRYDGPMTPATQLQWIERIKEPTNWRRFDNCSQYTAEYFTEDILEILDFDVNMTSQTVCLEEPGNVNITLNFTQGGTYDIVLTNGLNFFPYNNVSNGSVITLDVPETAVYNVYSISETSTGCPVYPNLQDAFIYIWVKPEIAPHYYMCEANFMTISYINDIRDMLISHDVELIPDFNQDGVPDAPPIQLFLEEPFAPFYTSQYIVDYHENIAPIVSGNYIVRIYANDKGGANSDGVFDLTTNNTYNNNDLNTNYNGCMFESTTWLTVFGTKAGVLALDPPIANNTFCYTGNVTHQLTVDGLSYPDFRFYEDGFEEDALGNSINYTGTFTSSNPAVVSVHPTTGQLTIHGPGAANITLEVKVQNPLDPLNPWMCHKTSTIEITVITGPSAGTFNAPQTHCAGTPLSQDQLLAMLSDESPGGTFSVNDSAISLPYDVQDSLAGEQLELVYTVQGPGCEDAETLLIDIQPRPVTSPIVPGSAP